MAGKSLSSTLHHGQIGLRREILELIPEFFNVLYDDACLASTDLREIRDHFRRKQLVGKSWLYTQLEGLGLSAQHRAIIIGGWLGFTARSLQLLGPQWILDCDPDSRVAGIAGRFNRFNPGYQRVLMDANVLDYAGADLVINTCTEHMEESQWFEQIPQGAWVALQGTDWPEEDHVMTVASLEEFQGRYPLDLTYAGTLDLDQYRRYMLIGRKS